ncbi:hypothetical protein LDENG_00251970 [Lucifuga dentata]|nr:hypothetical protein LDENG_00251970 [Lucifuga dentata]
MSVNSSSSYECSDSRIGSLISTVFTIFKTFLLLPLSVLILYLGFKRWWQRASGSPTSNSDLFTYNMAVMELIGTSGSIFYVCGIYVRLPALMTVWWFIFSITFPGQVFLHILTCVERYLAVVHPITYVGLRKGGGVRIRNISIGCVWLMSFGSIGLLVLYSPRFPEVPFFCILVFSLIVVSFSSFSVLRVLKRPGPGEGGGNRERVDQSKQRAFQTITWIMAVLLFWFVGLLTCVALHTSPSLSVSDGCIVLLSGIWFSVPSSLVTPLLFLHRAGKLPCFHYNTE